MKQRIEPAQLAELSPEQKEELREWWKPEKYDVCICNKYDEDHEVFFWEEFTSCTKEKKLELLYGGMGHHSAAKQQCLPLLSIGQMIEILTEHKKMQPGTWSTREHGDDQMLCNVAFNWWAPSHIDRNWELADALWEAVKAIL